MLRSIVKQSGESVESVLEKKKKAIVGRICNLVPCDRLGDLCQLSSARYQSINQSIKVFFIVA